MSIFSRAIRRVTGVAMLIYTAAASAQSFSPAVNGHVDVGIAAEATASASQRAIVINPAVNGNQWVVIPADRRVKDAARQPETGAEGSQSLPGQ